MALKEQVVGGLEKELDDRQGAHRSVHPDLALEIGRDERRKELEPLRALGPQPRVLYVEGRPTSAHYLYDALTSEGMEVKLGQVRDLPTSPEDYEQYDLVFISDVLRCRLNDAQMLSILTWVRDSGGGFIFAGGESSYVVEGYSDKIGRAHV